MTISTTPRPPSGRSPAATLNDYQLHLPGFEGPLEVLLRLIEREQLPIAELSLVQVTDQFLAVVAALDQLAPPQLLADFAAVGARLAVIKSRSLLPRPPAVDEEPDPGDLVQQLLRYREIRDAARHLLARDREDVRAFAAAPPAQHGAGVQPARLASYPPAALVRVIRQRLTQIAAPARVFDAPTVVTLREMVVRLADQLGGRRRVRFSALAAQCQNRVEVQTAFLAGLVLIRRSMADAEQDELFGEITFRPIRAVDGEFLAGLAGDVVSEFDPNPADDGGDVSGELAS